MKLTIDRLKRLERKIAASAIKPIVIDGESFYVYAPMMHKWLTQEEYTQLEPQIRIMYHGD